MLAMDAEQVARTSAFMGHDKSDVIRNLMTNYGLGWVEATQLVTREYLRRRRINDQDAANAEFDID